jgi:glycine cleavage system aminomethyltransferase T
VAALKPGRSKYHVICDERGGIIDDAIIYRLDDEKCLLVINAGNTDVDLAWLKQNVKGRKGVRLEDITAYTGMVAVQGPGAVALVDSLSDGKASEVRRFRIGDVTVAGTPCRIARTGYTGEDGFEIMPPAAAPRSCGQR